MGSDAGRIRSSGSHSSASLQATAAAAAMDAGVDALGPSTPRNPAETPRGNRALTYSNSFQPMGDSEELAVEGYLLEASRHNSPVPPPIFRH